MIVGIDLDNTLVCYDKAIYDVALEMGIIPAETIADKNIIRNHLRANGHEEEWIKIQGYIYGDGIKKATVFPDVFNFLNFCRLKKIKVFVISHKTLHPFRGEQYNLHESAKQWLEENNFYNPKKTPLTKGDIFLELTKEKKVARIIERKCDYFIDDLPEFLSIDGLTKTTKLILFDPQKNHKDKKNFICTNSWSEIQEIIESDPRINVKQK